MDTSFEHQADAYKRVDNYNDEKINKMASHYSDIITELGEDVNREGLLKTPERVAKAMSFLTHGYDTVSYTHLTLPTKRIV